MDRINDGDKISNFIFKKRIGKGGFGSVYKCTIEGSNNKRFAALKVVSISDSKSIENEKKILEKIQGGYPHFPRLYDAAQCSSFYYIAMEYLGPTLEDLKNLMPNKVFGRFTLIYVALQTLECIQELHSFGIIHRDIKPSNFLLRNNDNSICLTDFGLSTQYIINKRHIPFELGKGVGTVDFQSISSHKGATLSRKDDMESWIYSLLYLRDYSLPWSNLDASEVVIQKIHSTKELLSKWSPFDAIYNDIYHLKFTEEPHYAVYKELLNKSLKEIPPDDQVLDWVELDSQDSCCTIC